MASQPLSTNLPPSLSLHNLKSTAAWIRDQLDPLIAREGPDVMCPDDVLVLHGLFRDLQAYRLDRHTVAASRIYNAIREVSGKATRWPHKLADECDKVLDLWHERYGPLRAMRTPLYQRGGRLFKVCRIDDLTREDLIARWTRESRLLVDDSRAYNHWVDDFEPGQWWINATFAFRDGIIDAKSTDGGICADADGAYAIVLKDSDEVEGSSAYRFTYRSRPNDKGRYRLTAGDFKARYPVRILRSHSLTSLWAPKAGVRYDGLYKVAGWSVSLVPPSRTHLQRDKIGLSWLIHFEREPGQASMDTVLASPSSEDIDDYREYKRLRRLQREWLRHQALAKITGQPALTLEELEKDITGDLRLRTPTVYMDGRIVSPPGAGDYPLAGPRRVSTFDKLTPQSFKPRNDSTFVAPIQLQSPPTIGSLLERSPEQLQKMGRGIGISIPSHNVDPSLDETITPSKKTRGKGSAHHKHTQPKAVSAVPVRPSPLPLRPATDSGSSVQHEVSQPKMTTSGVGTMNPLARQRTASSSTCSDHPNNSASQTRSYQASTAEKSSLLNVTPIKRLLSKSSRLSLRSDDRSHASSASTPQVPQSQPMPGSFDLPHSDAPSNSVGGKPNSMFSPLGRLFDGARDLVSARKSASSPRKRVVPASHRRGGGRVAEELLAGSRSSIEEANGNNRTASADTPSSTRGRIEWTTESDCLMAREILTNSSRQSFHPSGPPIFYVPNWDAPSSSRQIRTESSATSILPDLSRLGLPRPTNDNVRPADAKLNRVRFQRLAHNTNRFANPVTAHRFLLALSRVWGPLAEAEYPDLIVSNPRGEIASSEGLDGASDPPVDIFNIQALQPFNIAKAFAHRTCPMSIRDAGHNCDRCWRVSRARAAVILDEKTDQDAKGKESAEDAEGEEEENIDPFTA